MKFRPFVRLVPPLLAAALSIPVSAQTAQAQSPGQSAQAGATRADFGKRQFDANCASCHGADGKGRGILVEFLRKSPPDLTQLARRNNGALPVSRLYEVIEGSGVPAHGTRDMPVWGRDYRIEAGEYYGEMPYDPESYVRVRILSLIDYINRLQAR